MQDLYEAGRQSEIVQETRGWDESKQTTFSQRKKEDSHDYRYFPDPDLPKLVLKEVFDIEKLKAGLPELPSQKRARYEKDFGIKAENIEIYVNNLNLAKFFEEVCSLFESNDKEEIRIASSLISNDLVGLIAKEIEKHKKAQETIFESSVFESLIFMTRSQNSGDFSQQGFNFHKMTPALFVEIVGLYSEQKITSATVKVLLPEVINTGVRPLEYAETHDLLQKNDEGALKEIAQRIIDANPAVVATYKSGKENALMSLVGQVMKETKGSANPQLAQKILKELI
jgi:aspartyl-tRNA(Asn)/glutamyl-tRNA(Gln) amidotransferase subunit B